MDIYISIKTALNDAMNGKFMVKLDHYNRTRKKDFYMGPSTKFVLTIIDAFTNPKMGVIFFLENRTNQILP